MCSKQDPLSLFKGLQMEIFPIGFSPKETGAKSVAMATTWKVSFCFLIWYLCLVCYKPSSIYRIVLNGIVIVVIVE